MVMVSFIGLGSGFRVRIRIRVKVVPASGVPQLVRAEVYISAPPPGVPKFLTLVKAQNKGLHTDRWVLWHQQSTSNGQFRAFIVRCPSIKT